MPPPCEPRSRARMGRSSGWSRERTRGVSLTSGIADFVKGVVDGQTTALGTQLGTHDYPLAMHLAAGHTRGPCGCGPCSTTSGCPPVRAQHARSADSFEQAFGKSDPGDRRQPHVDAYVEVVTGVRQRYGRASTLRTPMLSTEGRGTAKDRKGYWDTARPRSSQGRPLSRDRRVRP